MKKYFTLIAAIFVSGAMMAQDWDDNALVNGSMDEGEDYGIFHLRPNDPATGNSFPESDERYEIDGDKMDIQPGYGVDGSKGLKIVAYKGAKDGWECQFWVRFPKEVDFDEKVKISFDYRVKSDYFAELEEGEEGSIGAATQAHTAACSYTFYNFAGNLSATQEWQHFEAEVTITGDMGVVGSMAMNLSEKPEYDVEWYFDNFSVQYPHVDEDEPVLVPYWQPLTGDPTLESGNENKNFIIRIKGADGDKNAVPEQGVGVDDSYGIKIVVPAKAADAWDSQFFIGLNEAVNANDIINVKFDYKASETVGTAIDTQAHGAYAGDYNHYQCAGSVNFTDEWKTFEKKVTITNDMTKNGDNPMNFIAFNMAVADHEVTYYIDNIQVTKRVMVDPSENPEIMMLQNTISEMESKYENISGHASNAEIRAAFEEALENAKQEEEDFATARLNLLDAEAKFAASISDYNKLSNYISWAEEKMATAETMGERYEALKDKIDEIVSNLYNELENETWTRAEINQNTDQTAIRKMIAEYIGQNVQDGDDITIMIENPSFAGNTNGWQRDGGSKFLDYGPSNRNTLDMEDGKDGFLPTGMAEVWHGSFNAYQTLTDLPTGLYSISVNACQRGDDDTEETAMFYATVNGAETHMSVMSVYDDPAPEMLFDTDGIMQNGQTNSGTWPSIENPNGEGWIPDGKGSANYHLNGTKADGTGYYVNTLNVLVNEAGDIRFGIKDTNTTGWIAMDNFKVVYHSLDNKLALAAALEALVAQAEEVQNDGLSNPADDALYKSITTAEKVANNVKNESKESIDAAYNALLAAIDDAKANAKAIAEVEAIYVEKFAADYEDLKDNAMPETAKRAEKAYATFDSQAYMDMTTDELKAYAAELTYLLDALLVPGEAADANDDDPYDLTEAILVQKGVDVDFEDYSDIGANKDYPGWAGSKFGTGGGTAGPVGERWNQSNGFNTYVDLAGLPAGTYVLSCDGAYRTNLNDDYARLTDETKTTNNEAFLYATTSDETAKVALHNIATGAITAEECQGFGIDNTANCGSVTKKETIETGEVDEEGNPVTETKSTTLYCPDQLFTADQWIKAGYYKDNKVVIVVPADGKLRIGVQRKGAANDWCFVDNFALNYLGTNSKVIPTDIEGIATVPAVKAIYTISGVRVSNLNKAGIYIVNGKKLMVK